MSCNQCNGVLAAAMLTHCTPEQIAHAFVHAGSREHKLREVLKAFPQPGIPGRADWSERVIAWWNTQAREVLK